MLTSNHMFSISITSAKGERKYFSRDYWATIIDAKLSAELLTEEGDRIKIYEEYVIGTLVFDNKKVE